VGGFSGWAKGKGRLKSFRRPLFIDNKKAFQSMKGFY